MVIEHGELELREGEGPISPSRYDPMGKPNNESNNVPSMNPILLEEGKETEKEVNREAVATEVNLNMTPFSSKGKDASYNDLNDKIESLKPLITDLYGRHQELSEAYSNNVKEAAEIKRIAEETKSALEASLRNSATTASKSNSLVGKVSRYTKNTLIAGVVALAAVGGYLGYSKIKSLPGSFDVRQGNVTPYFFEGKIRAYIDEDNDSVPDNSDIKIFNIIYDQRDGLNLMKIEDKAGNIYRLVDSNSKVDLDLTRDSDAQYDRVILEEIGVQDKEGTHTYRREDLMDSNVKGEKVRETFKKATHSYSGIMKALRNYERSKVEKESSLDGLDIRDKYKVESE